MMLTALGGSTYLTGWPERTVTTPFGAYRDFLGLGLGIPTFLADYDIESAQEKVNT